MAASVLPKDVSVKNEGTDAFVQLWKLIRDGTAEQTLANARGEDDDRPLHTELLADSPKAGQDETRIGRDRVGWAGEWESGRRQCAPVLFRGDVG
jgi:hypothetical protein